MEKRENLAVVRTELANERTMLAYARTSVALFLTGLSLLKFFNNPYIHILGWLFVIFAIAFICIAFIREKKVDLKINKIDKSK